MHALGLLHEHQRPDRDLFIDVNMTAVESYGLSQQFRKACFLEFEIIGTSQFLKKTLKFKRTPADNLSGYDTSSIMHYDGTLRGFFLNPIMKDKISGESIGVNREMSSMDIQKINKMYPCEPSVPVCGKNLTVSSDKVSITYSCSRINEVWHE